MRLTIATQSRLGSRGVYMASRKVRTPQSRITVNDRPVEQTRKCLSQLRTRATETRLRWGYVLYILRHGLAVVMDLTCSNPTAQGETRQPLSGATPNRHACDL